MVKTNCFFRGYPQIEEIKTNNPTCNQYSQIYGQLATKNRPQSSYFHSYNQESFNQEYVNWIIFC